MVRHNFAAQRDCDISGLALIQGACIMASFGSFAWFFVGLFVGEVTLVFFLALIRQDSAVGTVESPPLAAEHEAPAHRESLPLEAT